MKPENERFAKDIERPSCAEDDGFFFLSVWHDSLDNLISRTGEIVLIENGQSTLATMPSEFIKLLDNEGFEVLFRDPVAMIGKNGGDECDVFTFFGCEDDGLVVSMVSRNDCVRSIHLHGLCQVHTVTQNTWLDYYRHPYGPRQLGTFRIMASIHQAASFNIDGIRSRFQGEERLLPAWYRRDEKGEIIKNSGVEAILLTQEELDTRETTVGISEVLERRIAKLDEAWKERLDVLSIRMPPDDLKPDRVGMLLNHVFDHVHGDNHTRMIIPHSA